MSIISYRYIVFYFISLPQKLSPPPPTLRIRIFFTNDRVVTTNSITFKTSSETLHLCTQIRVKIECRLAVIRNDSNRASNPERGVV